MLVFNTLIATALVLPVFHQEARKIGAMDFPPPDLVMPTPEKAKTKEDLIGLLVEKTKDQEGHQIRLAEDFQIDGVRLVVVEYQIGSVVALRSYVVYRELKGVLGKVLETGLFDSHLYFRKVEKGLEIKKGDSLKNARNFMTLNNFDHYYKILVNMPSKVIEENGKGR